MKAKNRFLDCIKKTFGLFIKSFKLKRNAIYVMLLDLAFFAFAALVFYSFSFFIAAIARQMEGMNFANILYLSNEAMAAQLSSVKLVLYKLIAGGILIMLLLLLVYYITRYLIWSIILKEKYNLKKLLRFILLGLLWCLIFLIIAVLNFALIRQRGEAFYFVIIPIFLYLTPILYISFLKSNKIWKSLKNSLKIGFKKIHLFILPVLLIAAAALILSMISYLVVYLGAIIQNIILLILLLAYLAWARQYFAEVVNKISG